MIFHVLFLVLKMIFHVLFLVSQTIETRNQNKLPTVSLNSFPSEAWWGILVIEDQGAANYS